MSIKKAIQGAGRPKIDEKMKHRTISFSASPALLKNIEDHAKQLFGSNRTKYIVHKLSQHGSYSNKNGTPQVDKIELYKLIKEVNKIGNNINQIARSTNLGFRKDEPLKNSLSTTQQKIDELITLMNTILQKNNPNFK
ncbi:MAG: plasmid mobilization relaxosome protein MobC [Maribacter sp.]